MQFYIFYENEREVDDMIVKRVERLLDKYAKLFLEQDISDLGDVPISVYSADEPPASEVVRAIDDDIVQKFWEELKGRIADAFDGIEVSEVEGEEFALLVGDVFVKFIVVEGEPQVVFRKRNGDRVTISLTLTVGQVIDEAELIKKLAESDEFIDEFVNMYKQVVGDIEEQEERQEEGEVQLGRDDEGMDRREEALKRLKRTERRLKVLKEKLDKVVTVKVADDTVRYERGKDITSDDALIARKTLERMNFSFPDLSKKVTKASNASYPDIFGFYVGGKVK